jgi:hypothetical protein
MRVTWVGGVWWIHHDSQATPITDEGWLDSWLADHDAARSDLEFPSRSLRQRFIQEFGPRH